MTSCDPPQLPDRTSSQESETETAEEAANNTSPTDFAAEGSERERLAGSCQVSVHNNELMNDRDKSKEEISHIDPFPFCCV